MATKRSSSYVGKDGPLGSGAKHAGGGVRPDVLGSVGRESRAEARDSAGDFDELGAPVSGASAEGAGIAGGNDMSSDEGQTGLERNRGPGRRRTAFTKAAEEGEMTAEQFLFVRAIEAFKQANNKMFPSWTDVLEVVRLLGYRKTMPCELNLRGVEDWREQPDTNAGVRKPQSSTNAAATATSDGNETSREQRKAA